MARLEDVPCVGANTAAVSLLPTQVIYTVLLLIPSLFYFEKSYLSMLFWVGVIGIVKETTPDSGLGLRKVADRVGFRKSREQFLSKMKIKRSFLFISAESWKIRRCAWVHHLTFVNVFEVFLIRRLSLALLLIFYIIKLF